MCKYTLIGGAIAFVLIWMEKYMGTAIFAVCYAGALEAWHHFKNRNGGTHGA